MKYTLDDGSTIDLNRVKFVSKIWDSSGENMMLNPYKVGFTLRVKGKDDVEIAVPYQFSEWGQAKIKIKQKRAELVDKIRQCNPRFVDESS
ncbi:MAG: hypothetical protein GX294_05045 [Candidatus Cloacimonetes bacterium]|nr:hypothetical protein [Candidatus Cloacimonadota bacterium]